MHLFPTIYTETERQMRRRCRITVQYMREVDMNIYVMKKRPHRSSMCSFDDPVAVSRERRSVLRRYRYDCLRCSEEEK